MNTKPMAAVLLMSAAVMTSCDSSSSGGSLPQGSYTFNVVGSPAPTCIALYLNSNGWNVQIDNLAAGSGRGVATAVFTGTASGNYPAFCNPNAPGVTEVWANFSLDSGGYGTINLRDGVSNAWNITLINVRPLTGSG